MPHDTRHDPDGNGLAGLSYNPGWQWSEVWETQ
jgi:hypothetical protein